MEKSKRPKCPECNSSQVRVRVNGTIVCFRCGHIEPPRGQELPNSAG